MELAVHSTPAAQPERNQLRRVVSEKQVKSRCDGLI